MKRPSSSQPAAMISNSGSNIVLHFPESIALIFDALNHANLTLTPYKKLPPELDDSHQSIIIMDVSQLKEWLDAQHLSEECEKLTANKLILLLQPENTDDITLPVYPWADVMVKNAPLAVLKFKIDQAVLHLKNATIQQKNLSERGDTESNLTLLTEIGTALSTEKDKQRLMEMILTKCRQTTAADAGSLYVVEENPDIPDDPDNYFANKQMRFLVAQNDSRQVPFKSTVVQIDERSIYGYCAIHQVPLNFPDVYELGAELPYQWGGRGFDKAINYRTMSMLTVPMINWRGDTIGVVQLINSKTAPNALLQDANATDLIRPFDEADIQMVQSVASQASISIQNMQLVDSIQTLFRGFIKASVQAIESRDPSTSGHSQRVAELTVSLAEKIDRHDSGVYKNMRFNAEQLEEIRYASLLHDFGKIGVREEVLIKEKKLFPQEKDALAARFERIRGLVVLEQLRRKVRAADLNNWNPDEILSLTDEVSAASLGHLDRFWDDIQKFNEPTVLDSAGFDALKEIAYTEFTNIRDKKERLLSDHELASLSIARGSLTKQDREEIESHVTHSYYFLKEIPWTSDLRRVPDIAYAHHEKLDGTGYPNRLKRDYIPAQSKMMTISDIYDALTSPRHYKPSMGADRALNILMEEAKADHIDKDLLDVFIAADIYKVTADMY